MTDTVEQAPETTTHDDPRLGEALKIALDGEFHADRERFRTDLSADDILRDPDMTLDEAREWVREHLLSLGKRGWGNGGYPVHGQAADPRTAIVSFEAVAHADLSLAIKAGVQFGLFGGAVSGLGTDEQIAEWLPQIVDMDLLGCFAMTELGHGSDVQSLETTLTYDREADEIVVDSPTPSATKAYIGNAAQHGRMAATFGQLIIDGTSQGIHCVLVPIRDEDGNDLPGITTADHGLKGGLAGVDNGMITYDQVRVPRSYLLARYGGIDDSGEYVSTIASQNKRFFTMLGTLVRGRVCVGAGGAIAGRRALSIATRYALKRSQFPRPGTSEDVTLLDYQSHQRRLLPEIAKAYALGFAHNDLAKLLIECQTTDVSEARGRELESRAAGLKVAETRFGLDASQVAREACGGAGYMAENYLTLLRADVDVFVTFEGDNTVLEQLVAKGLLLGYRESWTGLDRREQLTRTADLVGRLVIEHTAARAVIERLADAAKRRYRSGEAPILDRGWHIWMFEERERQIVETLAMRFSNAAKVAAEDRWEAMNRLQDHMLNAARAHTERLILDAFVAGIVECTDPEAQRVLNKLCDLFVLDNLHTNRAWYLERGRISAGRSKEIHKMVNQICRELRPDALALVEGLGIPVEWVGAAVLEEGK